MESIKKKFEDYNFEHLKNNIRERVNKRKEYSTNLISERDFNQNFRLFASIFNVDIYLENDNLLTLENNLNTIKNSIREYFEFLKHYNPDSNNPQIIIKAILIIDIAFYYFESMENTLLIYSSDIELLIKFDSGLSELLIAKTLEFISFYESFVKDKNIINNESEDFITKLTKFFILINDNITKFKIKDLISNTLILLFANYLYFFKKAIKSNVY